MDIGIAMHRIVGMILGRRVMSQLYYEACATAACAEADARGAASGEPGLAR